VSEDAVTLVRLGRREIDALLADDFGDRDA